MYSLFFGFYHKAVNFVKNKIENFTQVKPEKGLIEKNLFLLLEHTSFFILGFSIFRGESWLYDITQMWDSVIDYKIIIYYYLYITRYIVQTKMLSKSEKGYKTYLLHHITTILLLVFSFQKFNRIGVIIGIIHDIADIPLLLAKIFHKIYETRNKEFFNIFSNFSFIVFVPLFFITRIYLNGNIISYIYYQKISNYSSYIDLYKDPDTGFSGMVCYSLLYLNMSMQIFWQIMIVKFAINMITGTDPVDEKDESYRIKKIT